MHTSLASIRGRCAGCLGRGRIETDEGPEDAEDDEGWRQRSAKGKRLTGLWSNVGAVSTGVTDRVGCGFSSGNRSMGPKVASPARHRHGSTVAAGQAVRTQPRAAAARHATSEIARLATA